jgi:hypothetical protein
MIYFDKKCWVTTFLTHLVTLEGTEKGAENGWLNKTKEKCRFGGVGGWLPLELAYFNTAKLTLHIKFGNGSLYGGGFQPRILWDICARIQ